MEGEFCSNDWNMNMSGIQVFEYSINKAFKHFCPRRVEGFHKESLRKICSYNELHLMLTSANEASHVKA